MYSSRKEMSRSARETATKVDKVRPSFFVLTFMYAPKISSAEDFLFPQPLPSPVKKPARATSKPSSKAKAKPRSRAGASAKSGTRPRGLPPDVRRRIEVIAQNLLATDTDFDDDDPIDFLR
jgi:hypothetical protein